MALEQTKIFELFFDESSYTPLFAKTTVAAGYGVVQGKSCYAICQSGNAMTPKDATRMEELLQLAAKTGKPVVTFYHSVGVTLEQGLESLQAMSHLTQTIGEISGVVPQIAVVLGVCGGTAAIQAGSADLCLMAKQGQLFLTPPFTSNANGDKLEGAGSAEFAEKAGIAAVVYETEEQAILAAKDVIMLLPANNLDSGGRLDFEQPQIPLDMADYCRIRAGASLIDHNRDMELFPNYGKRNSYTAFGTIEGKTVGVVATSDRFLEHESVTKIARFVRLCDTYSIPVITLVHSNGFEKSISEDLAGGIREAARLACTYADATTAKIAILAGNVIGAVYTALCSADITIAVQGCTVSPLEPKAMVGILFEQQLKEQPIQATEQKAIQYAEENCSAQAAMEQGLAQLQADATTLRPTVAAALEMLQSKRGKRLAKKHGNMAL